MFLHLYLPAATRMGEIVIRVDDFVLLPIGLVILLGNILGSFSTSRWNSIDRYLALLLVVFLLSTIVSSHFHNSLNAFLDFLRCSLVYYYVRLSIANGLWDKNSLIRILGFLGIGLTLIGVVQYVTNSDFGYFLKYIGESTDSAYVGESGFLRIKGTVKNTNIYGQWLMFLVLPFCIQWVLAKKSIHYKVVGVLFFLLMLFCVLATVSRGVLLFLMITILVFCNKQFNAYWKLSFSVLGAIMLVVILFSVDYSSLPLVDNFVARKIINEGDSNRSAYLDFGIKVFLRPKVVFFGTGLNSLFPALVEYGVFTDGFKTWLDYSTITDAIHNAFAKILVETGLFGFGLFSVLYLKLLMLGRKLMKWRRDIDTAVFFALMVGLIVPFNVYNSTIGFNVWFIVLVYIAMFVSEGDKIPFKKKYASN